MEKTSDLHALKRPELQRLAKKYGIKANMRNTKLIEALQPKLRYNASDPEENSSTKSSNVLKSLSPVNSPLTASDESIDGLLTLDDVQPLWNDLSNSEWLSEDSFKSKSPTTRRSSKIQKENEDSKENTSTRRSSRTKAASSPDANTQVVIQSKGKTPPNEVKVINGKTFSVPKSRARARITTTEGTPSPKPQKRKQSADRSKAKRRKGNDEGWKKNMRENVVSEIERKTGHTSELRSFLPGRKIPVFSATGVTVNKTGTTPSKFAKMHSKTFGKMESIDDYQKRKEQRIEKLFGSTKKREKLDRLSKPKTPRIVKPVTRPKPNFMSPKSLIPPPSRKSSIKQTTFKPTVTSTSKINTNFTAKASKLVTPKKVAVSFAKSPSKKKQNSPRTPAGVKKTSAAPRKTLTPFRPNNTLNTPQSAKKNTFNLQESLKKPLTWVPHKGPLKKMEDPAGKPAFKERMKNFKNPKVSTRDDRRKKIKDARSSAKSDAMMKRRGIK